MTFDLDFARDVIAISTDGTALMTKMGKDLLKFYGVEQIVCIAHTVYLVVGDIFYKEKKSKVADNNDDINEQVEEEYDFSLEDFETMKDIIDALEPLSLLVLNLCKRDSTQVTAERLIELTVDTLNALGSSIAKLIHKPFVKRILNRPNTDMILLIENLTKPSYLDWKTNFFGEKFNGKSIKAKAIALIKRLFWSKESIPSECEEIDVYDGQEGTSTVK